jgi:hypothetical protein
LDPRPIRLAEWREFLLTGGATLLLIPFAYWYRQAAGLERSEYIVSYAAFYAAYVINDPHFAVSYLLFYKNAGVRARGIEFRGAQQVRYLIAGFVVPIVLVGWICAALIQQSAAIMGGMIQLMFFLVGWHYVKQGFGVLVVLSARRNIYFSAWERFVILAHCFSGWAYAWTSPRELGGTYEESGVVYTALRHPAGLETVWGTAFALSTIALVAVLVLRWKNRAPFPPLAASCGFLMSVWLWTIYSSFDPLIAYVIPGLHSLQYWYFVYLLKRNEARADARTEVLGASVYRRLGLFFASSVGLGWLAFNGVPGFLDEHLVATTASMGPDPEVSTVTLGVTPYVAAFGTFINIHHYFLDHVIWRRENPDTRFLKA